MVEVRSLIKTITGASFLLVVIGIFIFLYAYSLQDSSIVFPKNAEIWNKFYTFYGITFLFALIGIGIYKPSVLGKLARANYWKSFGLKFIPTLLVTLIVLVPLFSLLKGQNSLNVFTAISYLPITTLISHIFVITQIEEILFGGLLFTAIEEKSGRKNANVITIILFPIWHLVKTGGNLILMATYVPLRVWWNYNRNHGTPFLNKLLPKFFGATPETQQSNAGSHAGWNTFVIGFVEPFKI